MPIFKKKNDVALVLSGGSARGIAHIGVLEVLEENKVPIDAIVGTSMGALIGGMYAAGKLKEFKQDIVKLSNSRLKSTFLRLKIQTYGRDPEKTIAPFLNDYLKLKKIEDLAIDFTATATDIRTGKEVFINKGSLIKAISASICLPGIFHPVEIGHKLLIDGGVVDPLPQKYGLSIANKVIAVNAMPKKYSYKAGENFYDVLLDASNIMSNTLINLENIINLKDFNNKKLVLLQLNTENRDAFDFYKINDLIEIGRKTAKKHLKEIIALVHNN
jgi:NTE family protein